MKHPTLRSLKTILALGMKTDPWRTLALFALTIIQASTGVLFAYWLKLMADGALTRSPRTIWTGVAGSVLTMVVFQLTNWSGFNLRNTLQERTTWEIDRRLIRLSAEIPGIEHHERPDYITNLELLRQERHHLAWALASLVIYIENIVQAGGTLFLLSRLHPLLLTLPAFAIPSLLVAGRAVKWRQDAMEKFRENGRLADHLFELATTAGPAKELRIFGIGSTIVDRHSKAWEAQDSGVRRADTKGSLFSTIGWMFFAAGYVAGMVLVVRRAALGQITPGDVLLAFTLGAQVNEQVSRAVEGVGWVLANLKTVGRYLWLADYATETIRSTSEPVPVPARLSSEIEVKDVTFRYPGTDEEVLSGLDLRIPAGSTVAVVGENGAGKTTLVKLLCRFYEPTEGAILADGIDIRAFDHNEWRGRMSAGFQDFSRFELIARETVGIGYLPEIEEEEAVNSALDRAGGADVVETLPQGLLTQLGKSFDEGAELSMGQWQKLALGRTMMRIPLVLILDEPTASLDATTEHRLFERFRGASERSAREAGAITILVSHRFSTVRMADLIVVMEGGRISEVGSHEELMASGLTYSELYELQARAYR